MVAQRMTLMNGGVEVGGRLVGLDQFLVESALTIGGCLAALERNEGGILLVVDADRHLLGTITDGDIRRGLLRGLTFEDVAADVMHRTPLKVPEGMSADQLMTLMTANGIRHVPVVSADGRVVDLALMTELVRPRDLGIAAVLMAGGEGLRLRPLTEDTPKPLLHVGTKPIIEHIIDLLCASGVREVYVSTCYLGQRLERALGDGSRWGIMIRYLRESQPLGTAGSLRLLAGAPSDPFLVMNGDLLTSIDLEAMLKHHRALEADLSVAVREYQVQVPFGVVTVAPNHLVEALQEKPIERHFVNAGIYLVSASVLGKLPAKGATSMPDLAAAVMADAGRVAAFPVVESWIDIGRPADFERAQKLVGTSHP